MLSLSHPPVALQAFLELQPSQRQHVGVVGMFELPLAIGIDDFQVKTRGMQTRADLTLKAFTVTLEKRQHQYLYREIRV